VINFCLLAEPLDLAAKGVLGLLLEKIGNRLDFHSRSLEQRCETPSKSRGPGCSEFSIIIAYTLRIGQETLKESRSSAMPGFGLEDGDKRAEGNVVAIFGSLFGSQQSLIAAPGQITHARLQFGYS
jgi:hypothetical protein